MPELPTHSAQISYINDYDYYEENEDINSYSDTYYLEPQHIERSNQVALYFGLISIVSCICFICFIFMAFLGFTSGIYVSTLRDNDDHNQYKLVYIDNND